MKKTRVILVGGFLGAGKTTLLWETAKKLMDRNSWVGLITNDQASKLVDTAFLEKQNKMIAEVSGSCFCCNFNGLTQAIEDLSDNQHAEIIIAEPVGSCTDLSATIIQPLKEKFNKELIIAPLTVLVDPMKLMDILNEKPTELHKSSEYILKKQLEEADIIVINKSDLLTVEIIDCLKSGVAKKWPKAKGYLISAKNGEGIDDWLNEVLNSNQSGNNLVEVNYDIYAEGEAVLGWLNATFKLTGHEINWDEIANKYLFGLSQQLDELKIAVGHVKILVESENHKFIMGNLTGKQNTLSIREGIGKENMVTMIVNARVQMKPEKLENLILDQLAIVCDEEVEYKRLTLKCLSPGRPNPTYRYDHIV